jgi:plastocyanin
VYGFYTLTAILAAALIAPGGSLLAAEHAIEGRVVDREGQGIPGAVVFVRAPAETETGDPPSISMDQIDKTFVPPVLPVVVGTTVMFPNYDQIHHHVYSFSRVKTFELPLYKGHDAMPVTFDTPGVVKIGCNIHDWMSAVILVLPTRHFGVTDEEGRFALPTLAEGRYTLAAWHDRSRIGVDETLTEIDVTGGAPAVTFELALNPPRSRPAVQGTRREP